MCDCDANPPARVFSLQGRVFSKKGERERSEGEADLTRKSQHVRIWRKRADARIPESRTAESFVGLTNRRIFVASGKEDGRRR